MVIYLRVIEVADLKKKETVLDILLLQRRGLSQRHISRKLGISRNTVKKYIENQGDQGVTREKAKRKSLVDPYRDNIAAWLEEDGEYRATLLYDRLRAMGFTGSYEIVKRQVHQLKAEQQRVAYMRFETEPGFQAQVDFGEFQVANADGSVKKLYLFSMILGYSRKLYGEFIERCDLPTFLDCHIRAFEHFGGIPAEILYDRMRNVFIGKLAGKDRFNDTLMAFALHNGFKPAVAPAYCRLGEGKSRAALPFHP